MRVAIFRSTKLNERNRDPDNAAAQNLLSGKRHSAGVEVDLSGRLTHEWEVFGSIAWVPVARIDVGAPNVPAGTAEGTGTRPSLTPKLSGTIWSTYQLNRNWRVGAGINARSSQTPFRNPAGIVAPGFVTGDLLAEYSLEAMLADAPWGDGRATARAANASRASSGSKAWCEAASSAGCSSISTGT